jgi:hypothetical protein
MVHYCRSRRPGLGLFRLCDGRLWRQPGRADATAAWFQRHSRFTAGRHRKLSGGGVARPGESGEPVEDAFPPPPAEVRTYVDTHRLDPVYLDGEVVTGATLPDTVELREIPDYNYRYVYVNGQPALIDPQTRRIMYVVR